MPGVPSRWSTEPSGREVLLIVLTTWLVFVTTICLLDQNLLTLAGDFRDNPDYIMVASAIRHWDFTGLTVLHFWGLPYLMAGLSTLTGYSDRTALLLISGSASLVSVAVAYQLWGGWVAGFFAILNFAWIQISFLGGSEPLFVALLFAAFLAARRARWMLAAMLASCSSTVRPLGFLALIGIGVTLLWQRDFRKFILVTFIALVIGGLYILPLWRYFGDPLATVHSYTRGDLAGILHSGLPSGWLFGLPFYAIIKGTLLYPAPWTNLILSFVWICFVLAGIVAMVATIRFRQYAKTHPIEIIFAALYLIALYSYNAPECARTNFYRFAIPIIPFVLFALERWIPKDRRLLWGCRLMSPMLAAAVTVGVGNAWEILRRVLT